ncbi:succinate dehydrogenase, cytochrome b556 subunit [Phenylobacterium sp.]|uniref:succinate dehydrogenase, cytochrome b556 subunit n=1 Tax=Phenylobacterium sp. TaxID=1871053 RepID=UPI0037C94747
MTTPVRERPLSPHLQVWRWHLTMLTSILHRASGMALYAGAILVAGWALALGAGPDAYPAYMDLLASPLGRLVLVGLTLSLFYHLANGIRHLFWDAGLGLSVTTSTQSGIMAMAFSVVATVIVWAIGLGQGGPQ